MHELQMLVRPSAVVLAELGRGIIDANERKFLAAPANSQFIVTPTTNNWLESGEILAKIGKDKGFEATKLRDLHFDVLIALTCRSAGALVTSNGENFELIRKYRGFPLEVW